MKKINKALISTITLVIVGLVISSGAYSVSFSKTETTPQDSGIVTHYLTIKSQPLNKRTNENPTKSLTFESAQITSGEYDEYHPSAAGSANGGFYAMMEYSEDGTIWHPVLYYSEDGVTWEAQVEFLYDNAEYTDFDQNLHATYGTFGAPPDQTGMTALIEGEISDGYIWDWSSYGFSDFMNNRIACYTFEGPEGDPGEWNFGGITFVGYNGYQGADIEGCPFVFYPTSDGYATIGWLVGSGAANCENTGSAMDLAQNIHYAIYDRDTGTGLYELLVRKDNFGVWDPSGDGYAHRYVTSKHVQNTTVSLKYPSIAAYDNKVVVACQKGDDVVVFYSTNGFTTYKEVLIDESASYPEVEVAGGGSPFLITYIKDDVLYSRTSNDGGATWSIEEYVSDNQVNTNYRAAHLDEFNGNIYATWEDTRNGNVDDYFDIIYVSSNNPPSAPTINGPGIGEPAISYSFIFNAVDPDGDQVKYIVNWGDGGSDTSALVNSGTDVTLSHTWAMGGTYTVTAKAQDSKGLFGPEATAQITIKKSKELNSPMFKFLQNYPNLVSILRYVLKL